MCQNDADPTGSSILISFIVKSSIVKKILIRRFALFRSFPYCPEEDSPLRKVEYEAKLFVQKRSQIVALCVHQLMEAGGGMLGVEHLKHLEHYIQLTESTLLPLSLLCSEFTSPFIPVRHVTGMVRIT
jgi:hypothetical protein